ncbi:hypothetical protein [Campylobacter sp. JMF_08 NE1]|uniref:hypothetical protein n=1 Tax=Campylobacter sp. JMF_08 NE1 TaxID=2983821 RepID=UPI0022E9B119|nr:hypothetical protein [Campylobacter sp. JMF_08 NE1]MDA3048689.1 hypothetical protein [Campylobacter sp. JMF_08 NE1]
MIGLFVIFIFVIIFYILFWGLKQCKTKLLKALFFVVWFALFFGSIIYGNFLFKSYSENFAKMEIVEKVKFNTIFVGACQTTYPNEKSNSPFNYYCGFDYSIMPNIGVDYIDIIDKKYYRTYLNKSNSPYCVKYQNKDLHYERDYLNRGICIANKEIQENEASHIEIVEANVNGYSHINYENKQKFYENPDIVLKRNIFFDLGYAWDYKLIDNSQNKILAISYYSFWFGSWFEKMSPTYDHWKHYFNNSNKTTFLIKYLQGTKDE